MLNHLKQKNRTQPNQTYYKNITELNIANTLHDIYEGSTLLKKQFKDKSLGMVGAVYDVHTGKVNFKSFAERTTELRGKPNPALIEQLNSLVTDDN